MLQGRPRPGRAGLRGLSWTVDADWIDKLLALLAVLIVECGAGLSLTVGCQEAGIKTRTSARSMR